MNERIRELFKRAGGKTSIHNLMSNPMQQREYNELWNENIDKFAELIVLECANFVENIFDDDGGHAPCEDYAKGIRRHFGVEQ